MSNFLRLNFDYIKKVLSETRIDTYLEISDGNTLRALNLYVQNSLLSKHIFAAIMEFEVVLRNKIDALLTDKYGQNWLWDNRVISSKRHQEDVAKHPSKNRNKVISSVTFGFWISLFGRDYDSSLWRTALYKIGKTRKGVKRNWLRLELEKIRNLRNRIAHNESIIKYPLESYILGIIELIKTIEPELTPWFEEMLAESLQILRLEINKK